MSKKAKPTVHWQKATYLWPKKLPACMKETASRRPGQTGGWKPSEKRVHRLVRLVCNPGSVMLRYINEKIDENPQWQQSPARWFSLRFVPLSGTGQRLDLATSAAIARRRFVLFFHICEFVLHIHGDANYSQHLPQHTP